MERIVVVGRGGTGKTSFATLIAKHFIEKGETPILLVDLDPDMNLAEMVGVDLEVAGKSTVSELFLEIERARRSCSLTSSPSQRLIG